ncbi:MAG: cation transporter [Bacteroidota bacterium]
MKTQTFILSIAFLFCSFFSIAQSKTTALKSESIKVWGNCGMCKSHIEKAAKNAGAVSANWNENTHLLTIKYNTGKTTNQQIQQSVANAGYDTKDLKGNDEAYSKLDECCQYDRKTTVAKDAAKQIASCCDKDEKCDKTVCSSTKMECCKNEAVKHDCFKNPANSCCFKSK